jgi:hypothetical protein
MVVRTLAFLVVRQVLDLVAGVTKNVAHRRRDNTTSTVRSAGFQVQATDLST